MIEIKTMLKETKGMYSVSSNMMRSEQRDAEWHIYVDNKNSTLLTSQTCTQGAMALIQESIYTCANIRNTYSNAPLNPGWDPQQS